MVFATRRDYFEFMDNHRGNYERGSGRSKIRTVFKECGARSSNAGMGLGGEGAGGKRGKISREYAGDWGVERPRGAENRLDRSGVCAVHL